MNLKPENIFAKSIPAVFYITGLFYIIFVVQPELIFHHLQPPFIFSQIFYAPFLKYPGGPAELLANLLLQSFYYRLAGSIVLFAVAFAIAQMLLKLLNSNYKSDLNQILALIPFSLTIILTGNYNFPFSVAVSAEFTLLLLLLLKKTSKNLVSGLLIYTVCAFAVYMFAGSGFFLVFSATSLFIKVPLKKHGNVIFSLSILIFAIVLPFLASKYIFPVSLKNQYFWFYSLKPWFMSFNPNIVFLSFLVYFPLITAISCGFSILKTPKKEEDKKSAFKTIKLVVSFVFVIIVSVSGHYFTFNSDARKIIEADYYCYKNNALKTAGAATTLKEYDFSANLNYNLVLAKTGKLTENFFGFLQIKGTESLHPDVEFASQLAFIASDFYYELGLISEARHWAYESLVFYPYSTRAMQNLFKIHLITGEYDAAGKMLNTLEKGITGRKFAREFMPYISDTTLVESNKELMEKRSFIPAGSELNPTIEGRLKELLETNRNNKKAYEFLMLHYLLGAQAEKFAELYINCGSYFEKTPAIYEEALLMFTARNNLQLPADIEISPETQNRYNRFIQKLEQYKGKTRLARNALYAEYGKTYLYFLQFVYPNIQEPEIIIDEDDYPAI